MSEKSKKKKINHLSLKDCEDIINRLGGQQQCQYVLQVMDRLKTLQAKKQFDKS